MLDINDVQKLSDQELVKLSLQDQDNFLYLVNRYKGQLISYIRRLTNIDEEGAEDILQEVFIKVYLNLNDFKDNLKFSSWIYRIAHNQVISNHRKLKARPEGYKVEIDDQMTRSLASEIDTVALVDKKLLKDSLMNVLNKLDIKHKEILILKYWEEKSYREISDIIKKPAGTVASKINKAKQEFKKELAKQQIKNYDR